MNGNSFREREKVGEKERQWERETEDTSEELTTVSFYIQTLMRSGRRRDYFFVTCFNVTQNGGFVRRLVIRLKLESAHLCSERKKVWRDVVPGVGKTSSLVAPSPPPPLASPRRLPPASRSQVYNNIIHQYVSWAVNYSLLLMLILVVCVCAPAPWLTWLAWLW